MNETEIANPTIGAVYLSLGVILPIPYIPCAIIICQKPLILNSCYKIMAAMAVVDLAALFNGGVVCGISSIFGTPNPEYSNLNKVNGALSTSLWHTYGLLNIILAINRWIDLRSRKSSKHCFGIWRTNAWLLFVTAYFIANMVLYLSPYAESVYRSGLGLYFLGGRIGLTFGIFHNLFTAVSLPILYFAVCTALRKRSSEVTDTRHRLSKKERRVIYQAMCISLLVIIDCATYLFMPFLVKAFDLDLRFYVFPHLIWFIAHAGNSIIYLTINKTIRIRVIGMFAIKSNEINSSSKEDHNRGQSSSSGLLTGPPSEHAKSSKLSVL